MVEKCIYIPQKRVVAVKRLRADIMKTEEDLKVRERHASDGTSAVLTRRCSSDAFRTS